MEGQPWHFDKFIWCFNDPYDDGKLSDTPLFLVPIWARVYDLPVRERANGENIRRLGMQLGQFVMVDQTLFPEIERAIRIRVVYDVRKPLKSKVGVRMLTGLQVEFEVKYERLPIFCYGCGILGHDDKDCDEGPYDEGELQFSEALRASP
ncbi:uncharacterized protein LOC141620873 [Silene latifolia]|uniref:uncharacterized protein LOC141620873 n=1 Tax=Silene latifolia TaxID=37657 RepID=UPI003D76F130